MIHKRFVQIKRKAPVNDAHEVLRYVKHHNHSKVKAHIAQRIVLVNEMNNIYCLNKTTPTIDVLFWD